MQIAFRRNRLRMRDRMTTPLLAFYILHSSPLRRRSPPGQVNRSAQDEKRMQVS